MQPTPVLFDWWTWWKLQLPSSTAVLNVLKTGAHYSTSRFLALRWSLRAATNSQICKVITKKKRTITHPSEIACKLPLIWDAVPHACHPFPWSSQLKSASGNDQRRGREGEGLALYGPRRLSLRGRGLSITLGADDICVPRPKAQIGGAPRRH